MREPRDVSGPNITLILRQWQQGDKDGLNRLITELYGDFKRMAQAHFRPGKRTAMMSPTVLVHETCLKLFRHRPDPSRPWRARGELFGLVSSVMLSVLADEAKRGKAVKHGGGLIKTTFDSQAQGVERVDLLALKQALQRLGELDPRQSKIWQCRHLCGFSIGELARAFSLAESSVYRELKAANAWVRVQLGRVVHGEAGF